MDIFIVGVISIVIYGFGEWNGNFVSVVVVFEIVIVVGDVVKFFCDVESFYGVVVGLGVVGVIVWIIFDIQLSYMVWQYVYQNLLFVKMWENFDMIMVSGYSVSFFIDWQNQLI